jgi:hypothetical protein
MAGAEVKQPSLAQLPDPSALVAVPAAPCVRGGCIRSGAVDPLPTNRAVFEILTADEPLSEQAEWLLRKTAGLLLVSESFRTQHFSALTAELGTNKIEQLNRGVTKALDACDGFEATTPPLHYPLAFVRALLIDRAFLSDWLSCVENSFPEWYREALGELGRSLLEIQIPRLGAGESLPKKTPLLVNFDNDDLQLLAEAMYRRPVDPQIDPLPTPLFFVTLDDDGVVEAVTLQPPPLMHNFRIVCGTVESNIRVSFEVKRGQAGQTVIMRADAAGTDA